MYRNLEAELKRSQISRADLAASLNISTSTLNQKLKKRSDFTLTEAIRIKQDVLGVNYPLEFLFEYSPDNF